MFNNKKKIVQWKNYQWKNYMRWRGKFLLNLLHTLCNTSFKFCIHSNIEQKKTPNGENCHIDNRQMLFLNFLLQEKKEGAKQKQFSAVCLKRKEETPKKQTDIQTDGETYSWTWTQTLLLCLLLLWFRFQFCQTGSRVAWET